MNSKHYSFFIVLVCLFLGACNHTTQVLDTKPSIENATKQTITLSATNTVTKLPSLTPPPSLTPSPTSTVVPSTTNTHTITASPTPMQCWTQGGQIETGTLQSKLLRLPLDYRVYTPPCYEQQEDRRYPVLYLMHGQSFTDEQWVRIGAGETVDRLVAENEIEPFIIVMPRDRYGGQPTESDFPQVIIEEFIPLIDTEYRTIPDRDHRAVGGMSRGAGWAIHFAIAHWDTFSALGAHSPAVFHTDAQRMRTWLDTLPESSYPNIYIDIGDKDRPEIMRSAIWFEDLLNEKDVPHEWYLFSGYHSEEYWQDHIEQYIRWYAKNWQ